jgi:hypothetical protein
MGGAIQPIFFARRTFSFRKIAKKKLSDSAAKNTPTQARRHKPADASRKKVEDRTEDAAMAARAPESRVAASTEQRL